jgi:hypothetical protein
VKKQDHILEQKKVSFYRIPTEASRRREWLAAINRKNFEPTASHRLCGDHFISGNVFISCSLPLLGIHFSPLKGPLNLWQNLY